MSRARLYAGAGIVQGSVPELELAETRLKLRALLAPLTEI
jgi:isochorismate synthase EntC